MRSHLPPVLSCMMLKQRQAMAEGALQSREVGRVLRDQGFTATAVGLAVRPSITAPPRSTCRRTRRRRCSPSCSRAAGRHIRLQHPSAPPRGDGTPLRGRRRPPTAYDKPAGVPHNHHPFEILKPKGPAASASTTRRRPTRRCARPWPGAWWLGRGSLSAILRLGSAFWHSPCSSRLAGRKDSTHTEGLRRGGYRS